MVLSFTHTIGAVEVARQLSDDPAETLAVLTEMTLILADPDDAAEFAGAMADAASAQDIASSPGFLRLLADRLEGTVQ